MKPLFAQIFKVNAVTGEVHGRITEEAPDSSGEIMDYLSSKPYFQAWSKDISDATGGASLGNVRAMHGKVAAGKLTEISYLDEQKAIDVVAKIIDPVEWAKCLEGVYTGFSIGGKYAKRWHDEANAELWRYTAQPSETSLVDNPCLKTARYTLVKAEGEQELAFKVAARSDTNPAEGKKKYGDVKFADEKNKKYPIDTEGHIRAAWNYINKGANSAKYSAADVKTIKGKIVAAWKDKIDPDGPPSAKEKAETWEELVKCEIDDAATAIYALQSIKYLYMREMVEAGEDPEDAKQAANLEAVIDNLKAFIASEIMEDSDDESMQMAEGMRLYMAKVGARNSKGDADKIQTIHDHAASLGADCGGKEAKAMTPEELQKFEALTARVGVMEKGGAETKESLEKITAENAGLKEKLEKAEADLADVRANTAKPGGPMLRVISKAEEMGQAKPPVVEPIKKADGTVDLEATAKAAMEVAMANPFLIPGRAGA